MSKMINISHGHALPGGLGSGAVGYHDESLETKAITELLVPMLNTHGVESHDCSCNKHIAQYDCLKEIVANHNKYKDEDLSVSLHLNYLDGKEKADGKNKGIEILVYSTSGSSYKIDVAKRILKIFEDAGFTNRGIKERPDLMFLKSCNSPSLLIELYFCDDKDDVLLAENFGRDGICRMLAEGILDKQIRDICYGTKVRIRKRIKLRSSSKSDFECVGYLLKGDVVTVLETNKNCTRGKVAEGHWITLSAKCVEVVKK